MRPEVRPLLAGSSASLKSAADRAKRDLIANTKSQPPVYTSTVDDNAVRRAEILDHPSRIFLEADPRMLPRYIGIIENDIAGAATANHCAARRNRKASALRCKDCPFSAALLTRCGDWSDPLTLRLRLRLIYLNNASFDAKFS